MKMVSESARMSNSSSSTTVLYYEPEECPICKKAIKPFYIQGFLNIEFSKLYLMFECRACHNSFIKTCDVTIIKANTGGFSSIKEKDDTVFTIAPNPPVPIAFSKYINEISSKFVDIYNQANSAECYGLNEIAGIGYRKSIEFLVKDYLVLSCESDDEAEAIKNKALAQCISQDINNENLRIVASRAVWIGNDETHYIRKHEDKDIVDLKRLIGLTVRWIEMECMTKEAKGIPYIK
ncbi:hypothetical protein [Caproiciproducens sp. CPB-2]|uniref:hypothetical protein n=1 Tax=Caproiciproducens sp. CPB-2 TaxID=3030017 RepID=UPI0023D9BC12|nr:hypothetical protein [Caproiciproducens sp. CPB-2]MDF1495208.1 hypothetical protein [Caproiciproducens sp. CPB-2]